MSRTSGRTELRTSPRPAPAASTDSKPASPDAASADATMCIAVARRAARKTMAPRSDQSRQNRSVTCVVPASVTVASHLTPNSGADSVSSHLPMTVDVPPAPRSPAPLGIGARIVTLRRCQTISYENKPDVKFCRTTRRRAGPPRARAARLRQLLPVRWLADQATELVAPRLVVDKLIVARSAG